METLDTSNSSVTFRIMVHLIRQHSSLTHPKVEFAFRSIFGSTPKVEIDCVNFWIAICKSLIVILKIYVTVQMEYTYTTCTTCTTYAIRRAFNKQRKYMQKLILFPDDFFGTIEPFNFFTIPRNSCNCQT